MFTSILICVNNWKDVQKLFLLYKKHSYFIYLFLVLCSGILLRVYNFQNSIGLGGDSGRDAMIAQVALSRHELPLFASFSSAGPFVFGPMFYWFNMLSYILNPFTFEAPWIITCMVGIVTVMIMAYIGYLLEGKRLSVILGLLTAFSPQFIARSTFLSQHGLVGAFGTLLILFFVLFYQRRKLKYAFLMGLSLGMAISMHYQALNLLLFAPALLFIPKINWKEKILAILLMGIGILLPALPLIYWDSRQNFANMRNLMDYLLIGQYRIYVPNNWRIYLSHTLPDYWSDVVGGNKPVAFIVMFISGISYIYALLRRTLRGEIAILGMILGVLLLVIRYYRGEKFEGYLIYIAPLIFVMSAWAFSFSYGIFNQLIIQNVNKNNMKMRLSQTTLICILFLTGIVLFDLKNASQFIFTGKNTLTEAAKNSSLLLVKKYPGEKIALYDYLWKTSGDSYALSLLLKAYGVSDPSGHPIGIIGQGELCIDPKIVIGKFYGNNIIDLDWKKASLVNSNWNPISAENIYDDLITRWTRDQKLTSTFSLPLFIEGKLNGH